ncbi:MAG: ATP-binding cassette domain-containing protein [Robiginitomaculum sp.]
MLSIKNVSKSFGKLKALDDVSLELGPGLFGLLGPNGAGKSTLMRSLATLLHPSEGSIHLNGTDIVSKPNIMRTTLGYLPQGFGVYPRMSATALLDHMAILKGVNNKGERQGQIESLLKSVNLWEMRNANVSNYSGGMRQRFGVAQALLGDPKVLIVDEPTAGLDPYEQQRFLDLLSESGEDKTIILSTHIVSDVANLCPDMAIMNKGKIVARGAPDDLTAKLSGKVFRALVDKGDVEALSENYKVLSTRLVKGRVLVSVYADGAPGGGFKASEETLEDAYFAHLYNFAA